LELTRNFEKQKQISIETEKENDKNIMNIMKNEYENKFSQYKKLTVKKLDRIRNKTPNSGQKRQEEQLEDLINVGLDDFTEDDYNDNNYLPKSDTEDSNNTVFKYIKDNSLLKQANYFLEMENQALKKDVEKFTFN
jgi:hypothetical protein